MNPNLRHICQTVQNSTGLWYFLAVFNYEFNILKKMKLSIKFSTQMYSTYNPLQGDMNSHLFPRHGYTVYSSYSLEGWILVVGAFDLQANFTSLGRYIDIGKCSF